MATKKCLRSGQCCSGMFGFVPTTEKSDLSPKVLELLDDDVVMEYLAQHAEPMGAPCKWLVRDETTTEATCKVHEIKSSDCLNYPEYLVGSEWCNVGVGYWRERKQEGLPIPAWIDEVLATIK